MENEAKFNFYNMRSGIKNDPQADPNLISYINPILIRNELGNLENLSQETFSLRQVNFERFVVNFFDYSVRNYALITAYCIKLAKDGGDIDKIAAEGLFKVAQDIRTLGTKVVIDNQSSFINNSKELCSKYHLELQMGDKTTPTLNNLNHVYNSWMKVCQAIIYVPQSLDKNETIQFNRDMEIAVESGAPAIIWYLSGAIDNDSLKWQSFVDTHLASYWKDIPSDKRQH